MDFMKFFSLVETSTLYLPSAELLAIADPYEGTVTAMTKRYKQIQDYGGSDFTLGSTPPDRTYTIDTLTHEASEFAMEFQHTAELQRRARRCIYISSWHLSEFESVAMWKLYTNEEYGVAIVSNLERIKRSLNAASEEVYLGKVTYLDYENEYMHTPTLFDPFLHKIRGLNYENEVRVVTKHRDYLTQAVMSLAQGDDPSKQAPSGVTLQCDPTELIEEIVVSPKCRPWVYDLVSKYVADRVQRPVTPSRLITEPHFG